MRNIKKEITVTIPVFNGEKYILEALQSIINQTIKIDHIIICDNHSTDNTVKIVEKFKSEYKDWDIQLHINNVNLGNMRNYNKCMELCHSDYLLILSSDDKLKPDTIEKQVHFLEEHPEIAFVAGKVDYIDENGLFIGRDKKINDRIFKKGEILELIQATNLWIQHSAVLFNTKYTKNIGKWEYKLIGGDERFYARVLRKYPIALLGDFLVEQRVHSEQLGTREHLRYKDKIMHFETNLKVADWEENPERARKARKILKNWIAAQSIVVSKSAWKNFGKKHFAIKYWFYGLKTNPNYYFNRYIYSNLKRTAKRILIK